MEVHPVFRFFSKYWNQSCLRGAQCIAYIGMFCNNVTSAFGERTYISLNVEAIKLLLAKPYPQQIERISTS